MITHGEADSIIHLTYSIPLKKKEIKKPFLQRVVL